MYIMILLHFLHFCRFSNLGFFKIHKDGCKNRESDITDYLFQFMIFHTFSCLEQHRRVCAAVIENDIDNNQSYFPTEDT